MQRLTEENLAAYCDYYGVTAKEFQPGYHDGDYEPELPPEMSWEEFCLYNDKEPYEDYQ